MTALEHTYDFMQNVIKQNKQMLQLLDSFDSRVAELDAIVKETDEMIQDTLHLTEYFEDKEPAVDEYAKIGMKISELRTRRRDAKKALFILQQNRLAIKGLLPAINTAGEKLKEPSERGNPSYYMYRLRNDDSMDLIETLPSFDMSVPVQIVKKFEGRGEPDPEFFKPKAEPDPVPAEVVRPSEPDPVPADVEELPPMNYVRYEKGRYLILRNGELLKKSENFIEVIMYLTEELNSSETQFVGKVYKSFQTFAKTFRAGKHRNAQNVNPMSFEKLASNAYCG